MNVGASEVERTMKWVRDRLGIPSVAVGGSAITRWYPVSTKDVDLLIMVGEWKPLDKALQHRPEATPLEPYSGTIRSTRVVLGHRAIDVEFVSGAPFSGERSGDEFVEYVLSQRSEDSRGIHYARPEVVFYMRLMDPEDWRVNVPSIQRDVAAGVPWKTFDEVAGVARHFGTEDVVRERVKRTKELLGLFR
jgi:hypothetical protein